MTVKFYYYATTLECHDIQIVKVICYRDLTISKSLISCEF